MNLQIEVPLNSDLAIQCDLKTSIEHLVHNLHITNNCQQLTLIVKGCNHNLKSKEINNANGILRVYYKVKGKTKKNVEDADLILRITESCLIVQVTN